MKREKLVTTIMALAASGWMKVIQSPNDILDLEVQSNLLSGTLYITVGQSYITSSVQGFMTNAKISSIKSFGIDGENLRIESKDGSTFARISKVRRTLND